MGITFLITVYNEAETLRKAIQDVLAIKYQNKEIIIIN